jgi:hypothetical protein
MTDNIKENDSSSQTGDERLTQRSTSIDSIRRNVHKKRFRTLKDPAAEYFPQKELDLEAEESSSFSSETSSSYEHSYSNERLC